ncbi:hypothetical protein BH09MYX1_BH09MYX1_43140 [soil metagenome]
MRLRDLSNVERAAFVALALACACVMVDVGTGFVRFDLPKELAVHLFVVVLLVRALARGEPELDAVDRGAGLFVLTLLPALVFARVPALVLRQGAWTTALVALFVVARTWSAPARTAAVGAGVVLAASAIGEALGLWSLSAPGFAPGGLVGQRNHLAHAAVLALALLFGAPAVSRRRQIAYAIGAAFLACAIVLTRCRTGYLAGIVAIALALPLLPDSARGARASLFGTIVGVVTAVVMPISISWTVASPYLDSTRRLFESSHGSGAVRLEEARATLRLMLARPLFGVGAGQWSAEYAAVAPAKVRALAVADGSVPRLSHDDLFARIAEGGIVGVLGALVWLGASLRSLGARSELRRVAPLAGAFVVVELLDAGISIPATGLIAALGFASMMPRSRAEQPAATWARAPQLAVVAVSLAAVALLLRLRAADRAFVVEDSPTALVGACENDGTAASHCVDAARRALVVGDRAGAARAVAALERSYRAHPAAAPLQREIAAR